MTDTATILDPQHAPNGDKLRELSNAAQVAASWDVATRPTNAGNFQERVQAAREAIQELELQLTPLPAAANPDDLRMIALLDLRGNPRLLRSAVTAVSGKPEDMSELPRVVLSSHNDEPRVATIASTYLRAVGGESMVERAPGAIGYDVGRHSPIHGHDLELLDEVDAVDGRGPRLVAGDAADDLAESMDRVSSDVGTRGVGANARHFERHSQRSLATGLDAPARGLGEHRGVGVEEVRAQLRHLGQAGLTARDLLARVEDPCHLDRARRRLERELEHHGERALHVTGTEPAEF